MRPPPFELGDISLRKKEKEVICFREKESGEEKEINRDVVNFSFCANFILATAFRLNIHEHPIYSIRKTRLFMGLIFGVGISDPYTTNHVIEYNKKMSYRVNHTLYRSNSKYVSQILYTQGGFYLKLFRTNICCVCYRDNSSIKCSKCSRVYFCSKACARSKKHMLICHEICRYLC